MTERHDTAVPVPVSGSGSGPVPAPAVPTAERHRGLLLRYAARLTRGDLHRAEDIV
ncbi:hypothetical protein ACIRD3_09800 [Kitasatospora sp. NPDC093550]|uniref:hypothetical protein n=1 Tax=Kitasatospora sp. NPDC093550 TaxID=3364089 RepID=UPI0037F1877D